MEQFDIVAPIVIGSIAGLALSVLFVQYGYVKNYSMILFGKDSNIIITGLVLFGLFLAFILLSAVSINVFDMQYILKEPLKFLIELASMAIVPIIPILLMYKFRKNNLDKKLINDIILLGAKFSVFHILFELSGYYRYVL